jgi:hypothetical protein
MAGGHGRHGSKRPAAWHEKVGGSRMKTLANEAWDRLAAALAVRHGERTWK